MISSVVFILLSLIVIPVALGYFFMVVAPLFFVGFNRLFIKPKPEKIILKPKIKPNYKTKPSIKKSKKENVADL